MKGSGALITERLNILHFFLLHCLSFFFFFSQKGDITFIMCVSVCHLYMCAYELMCECVFACASQLQK